MNLIKPKYDEYGEERKCNVCLCDSCIEAIKSRGEKVFVGERFENSDYDDWQEWFDEDYEDEDEHEENEPLLKCDWCEEGCNELYECLW